MSELSDVRHWLNQADALLITAGNGVAPQEGALFDQRAFAQNYHEWSQRYPFKTLADALTYKFPDHFEKWRFWGDVILKTQTAKSPIALSALKKLTAHRPYFVMTNTFGHFFENAGFDPAHVFNLCGDLTQMQCSSGINHGIQSSLPAAHALAKATKDRSADLIPKCPVCQKPMELRVALNERFMPDRETNMALRWFLTANEDKRVVVLSLGLDENGSQLRDPITGLVSQFKSWHYVTFDANPLPESIQARSMRLDRIDPAELLPRLS